MYQKLLIFAAKHHLFWGSYTHPTPVWAKDLQAVILKVCAIYGAILYQYPQAIPVAVQAEILKYGVFAVPVLVLFFGMFKLTMPGTIDALLHQGGKDPATGQYIVQTLEPAGPQQS